MMTIPYWDYAVRLSVRLSICHGVVSDKIILVHAQFSSLSTELSVYESDFHLAGYMNKGKKPHYKKKLNPSGS